MWKNLKVSIIVINPHIVSVEKNHLILSLKSVTCKYSYLLVIAM